MTAHTPTAGSSPARPLRVLAFLAALLIPIGIAPLAAILLLREGDESRRAFARRLLVVSLLSLGAGAVATLARL
jgi:hypothetical protein